MGSNINFSGLGVGAGGGASGGGGGGGRPPTGNYPLARQPSVFSLTFEEFQNSLGGLGKDFGSMNMDELLKSIWSAEETQNMVGSSTAAGGGGGQETIGVSGGYLQRQGSLTLPRTLSQKTVDEVWRDVSKEFAVGKDGSVSVRGESKPQRQQTLGEITLEEFLVRAGVVREDTTTTTISNSNNNNNSRYLGDVSEFGNQSGLDFGYQQHAGRNSGLMGGKIPESSNQIAMQSANLPLNVNGARSAQQQIGTIQPQQQQRHQQQPQPLFPKQPNLAAYGASMAIPSSGGLGSPGLRGGIVGISDPAMNNNLVQSTALQGGGMGMVGLGAGGVTVATGSPAVSSDGIGKSNGDLSSVSPVPYVFNGGLRGRKSSALEKVVERRQRRMIKNRESAARSRARKQAYTMELEAEVAKLKEENEKLRKKQEEIMEMQKNQVEEMMSMQPGAKRRCLRRTQTGPW